jgi:hypothetical protein
MSKWHGLFISLAVTAATLYLVGRSATVQKFLLPN